MAKNTGKNAVATRVGQLIAGTKKRFPNGSQKLTLGGGSAVTVDEAVAELQKLVDNRAAVTAAKAAAQVKVEAERSQAPALDAFVRVFEAFVRFTFGTDTAALADFGLAPPRARAPLTAEQKAVAAAKRAATREARGTKSAKAKKSVHGNVAAKLVVTPVTVVAASPPATVSAPPTPAPVPSGGTTQPKG
jgi:hypothetical protein